MATFNPAEIRDARRAPRGGVSAATSLLDGLRILPYGPMLSVMYENDPTYRHCVPFRHRGERHEVHVDIEFNVRQQSEAIDLFGEAFFEIVVEVLPSWRLLYQSDWWAHRELDSGDVRNYCHEHDLRDLRVGGIASDVIRRKTLHRSAIPNGVEPEIMTILREKLLPAVEKGYYLFDEFDRRVAAVIAAQSA